jgi:hypothetical protein
MDEFFGPDRGIAIDQASSGPSSFDWMIFALLCALLLIALISLVLDAYYRSNRPSGTLAVLDERYARGEIDRAAYLQARADLGGSVPSAEPSEAATEVAKPPARRKRTPPATAT